MKSSEPLEHINVAILLCTHNGGKYLSEQISSIKNQTHENWIIYVSDDNSSDETLNILKREISKNPQKMKIFKGPCEGFSKNFMSLASNKQIKADYFAFCDQDDVWEPTKLQRGIDALMDFSETPNLYCGRTCYTNKDLKKSGLSPLFEKKPGLRNALVQSIAGGNTMIFNAKTKEILEKTDPSKKIISHDWWCYLAVSAADGKIIYDPTPTIFYRQHDDNLVGSNQSIPGRVSRFRKLMSGQFLDWTNSNLDLLKGIETIIPKHNAEIISKFKELKGNDSLKKRLSVITQLSIYRQTTYGSIGLMIGLILKKI